MSAFSKNKINTPTPSPSIQKQLTSPTDAGPDKEVREIMKADKRMGMGIVGIINKGRSKILTPKEHEINISELDKQQNKEVSDMRRRGSPIYVGKIKKYKKRLEEIGLQISELNNEKIAIQHSIERINKGLDRTFKGTRRKRRHSVGGKTKKRRWSRKYKLSINCKKPKGFSQKQYCKGRLKRKTKRKLKKRRHSKKHRRR